MARRLRCARCTGPLPVQAAQLTATLDAVVVDHCSGPALAHCVDSLRAAGASRVVVVDNAVPPGTSKRELGGADGPRDKEITEIVEIGVNVGYGSGANRGAAECSSEFLLVCNPDVVLEVSALERLVEALEADRTLAVVGPKVLEPDGSRYPSARRFPSLLESAGHALAGLVAPDNRFTRRYRMTDLDMEQTTKVDWVSGSFMFWRRNAFEELGGFDEEYFMYGEDVDICWRAHRAGFGVAYVPGARITHVGGIMTRSRPYRMLLAHHRSALRFASRSMSGRRRALVPAVAVALMGRLLVAVTRQALAPAGGPGSGPGPSDR